jgi:hypothetical protein
MTCEKQIDTLLLLALPASGKSEVRRYLASLTPEQCRREFHIGQTVQLDDFPYVHLMRRIDQELVALGQEPLFFASQERPFSDPVEWGTLIELLNEDYGDLLERRVPTPESAARHLFDRLEAARRRVGGPPKLHGLPGDVLERLARAMEEEAAEQLRSKISEQPDSVEGRTIVLEFARGGPQGSSMPLPAPFGYAYALSVLSDEILGRSAVLYVWVTPEESRRKNEARADPDDPGSILHHGVPIEVMLNDYGCDDMEHLIARSDRADTVRVETRGKVYHLPVARFDNRVDKTTFVRDDPSAWKPEQVEALHEGLKQAFSRLARNL